MVYDRYYKVVTEWLDEFDPNHLYMGSRLVEGAYQDEYIIRVAGKYCDVITFNYYGVWEGDAELLANIEKWSGKPFVITEWYTKGMDACYCLDENGNYCLDDNGDKISTGFGLTNEAGAGWIVKTQDDRGKFYENYALQLLECKGGVGFDWFKYLDHDPSDSSADSSNKLSQ